MDTHVSETYQRKKENNPPNKKYKLLKYFLDLILHIIKFIKGAAGSTSYNSISTKIKSKK